MLLLCNLYSKLRQRSTQDRYCHRVHRVSTLASIRLQRTTVSVSPWAISDKPRGTLRWSQNRRLSERFCDQVLFDYVSFIQLPHEIKAFVSTISAISVVESIANLLKERFWKLFCLEDDK